MNILIVDDNPQNIQVLGLALKDAGYSLSFARDGAQALELAESKEFQLILLDVMMPGIDGFETCRRLQYIELNREVPVIFLSAKNDEESIVKGFESGGVDFIAKPFNKNEVLTRVERQIKFQTQKKDLENANAVKDKFFRIISHDLKQPLVSTFGGLELLRDNYGKYDDAIKLKIISELYDLALNNARMLELLSEWSRLERGKIECNPCNTFLYDAVAIAYEMNQGHYKKKDIKIEIEMPMDIEVYADTEMLSSVFRNLLNNAVKFTPAKGSVSVYVQKQSAKNVFIAVKDTGVGIEKSNMDKVFDKFQPFFTYGTEGEKGIGLGLMLTKEFLKRNNGSIWAESEVGKGTVFYLSIPAKKTLDISSPKINLYT